jgi:ribosomal protein S27E
VIFLKAFSLSLFLAVVVNSLNYLGIYKYWQNVTNLEDFIYYTFKSTVITLPLTVVIFWAQDKKESKLKDFICPSCEAVQTNLDKSKTHNCPSCGDNLVKLEGFYDGREK